MRRHLRSAGLVALIVAAAYVAGYRMETAVLRVVPDGEARGTVVVNRLAHTRAPATLALQGSYRVHPRDFRAEIALTSGTARAEYVVYRGQRVVRRAEGRVEPGQGLVLQGGYLSAGARTERLGSP